MKKFWIQISVLLIVVFVAMWLSMNPGFYEPLLPQNNSIPQVQGKITQIKIDEALINVEVADTSSKRAQGLSGRESLATGSGMLFIFPTASKYRFWMKDMKFPLDFIFIDNGKVVDLYRNVPPPLSGQADETLPQYEPVTPITMMLEVNAGFADQYNIKIGDQVFEVK